MPNLTQLITRQSGLLAWYPLTNDDPGSIDGTILDESGNGRDMAVPFGIPLDVIQENQLNGYRAMVHNEDVDASKIRQYVGVYGVRDIFIVGKVDDSTDFDAPYRGLFTGLDDANAAFFVGVGGTTRWLGLGGGAANMGYLLDDVLLADGARTAPFDAFRRMRMTTSGTAVTVDGWQVGRDREHTDRLFAGKWTDLMLFSSQRTAAEARAIALYYDLKFNLWRTNGIETYFPTPGMTGINYRRFYTAPDKWDDTVNMHTYEDGGISVNETTDTAVKEWEVEFDCVSHTHALAKIQYEIFDEFWNAVRTSRSFSFTDKYGTTHTGVRVKEYSRSHGGHKSWQNEVVFRLVKFSG